MALAGSVALASAAYAVGSQSGGGTSGAATSQSFRPVRAAGMRFGDRAGSLATRLGVSEARLRAAFDAIRKADPPPGDPRARIEKALADALGMPQSKVHDAFGKLQARHQAAEAARRGAFAKALANALGLDPAKVSKALDELRPGPGGPGGPPPGGPPGGGPPGGGPPGGGPPPGGPRGGGPRAFLDALAGKLGVDPAKLRAALEKLRPAGPMGEPHPDGGPPGGHLPGHRFLRPGGPPHFGPRGFGPPGRRHEGARRFGAGPPAPLASELAGALGVKPADVIAAFAKIRPQLEAEMQARRARLATELAKQLGLPDQKVKDALAAGPFGPHGPPGPPGP